MGPCVLDSRAFVTPDAAGDGHWTFCNGLFEGKYGVALAVSSGLLHHVYGEENRTDARHERGTGLPEECAWFTKIKEIDQGVSRRSCRREVK